MAKNRLRRIVVDKQLYYWQVTQYTDLYALLSVFDEDRAYKNFPMYVRFQFTDVMANYGTLLVGSSTPEGRERIKQNFRFDPMTSGIVADVIRQGLILGWAPRARKKPLHCDWLVDTHELIRAEEPVNHPPKFSVLPNQQDARDSDKVD